MNLTKHKRITWALLLFFCCTLWINVSRAVAANTAVYVHTSPFIDISNAHWSFGNVIKMNLRRVVAGHPDGTFRPDNNITQLEAVLMAVRNLDADSKIAAMDASARLPISVPSWAEETKTKQQLLYAIQQNLLIPGENNFIAEQPATRAWVIQLIIRMVGKDTEAKQAADQKSSFKDDSTIPVWAQGYVNVAVREGLLAGYPDGTFKPFNKITRAETVAFMSRSEKFIAMSTLYTGKIISISGQDIVVETANNKYAFTADSNTWSFDQTMKSRSWNQLQVGDQIKYLLNGNRLIYTESLGNADSKPVITPTASKITGTVLYVNTPQKLMAVKTKDSTIFTGAIADSIQITNNTNTTVSLEQVPVNVEVELGLNSQKEIVTIAIAGTGGDIAMQGTIFQIVPEQKLIIIKNALGSYFTYQYTSMLNVTIPGQRFPTIDALMVGDEVSVKVENGTITDIALIKAKQDVLITGKLVLVSAERNLLIVEVNNVAETYYLAANPTIVVPGYRFALLSDLRNDSQVELTIKEGKVTQVTALSTDTLGNRFTAKIAAIDNANQIVVLDYKDKLYSYTMHKNANIEIGSNNNASLSDLKKEMEVEVQLLNDQIIFITNKNAVEGTVLFIDDDRNLLSVNTAGGSNSYVLSSNVIIYIEGVNRPRLLDVKPGDKVSLEINQDVITRIDVQKTYIYVVDDVYDSSNKLSLLDQNNKRVNLYVARNVELVVPNISYPSLADFRRGDHVEATFVGESVKKLVLMPAVK